MLEMRPKTRFKCRTIHDTKDSVIGVFEVSCRRRVNMADDYEELGSS